MEDVSRAVVDVHFAHSGAFHHGIEGREIVLDKTDEFHWVVFDGSHRVSEALEALQVWHQAEGHHGESFGVEVAEEEPVMPLFVEVLVEFSDLGDGVKLLGVVVPAVHEELERSHHDCEFGPLGESCRAVLLEEVGDLSLAHLHLAEDDNDGVMLITHGLMTVGCMGLAPWLCPGRGVLRRSGLCAGKGRCA